MKWFIGIDPARDGDVGCRTQVRCLPDGTSEIERVLWVYNGAQRPDPGTDTTDNGLQRPATT